jgi:hypothetical protein
LEIFHDVLLVAVDPTSQADEEELKMFTAASSDFVRSHTSFLLFATTNG